MWNVLVVEDNSSMREFFSRCVSGCAELQLMDSVGTVAQAKDWLDEHAGSLDVLLTDLGLPDGSGLEVIRYALQRSPACEPLVISMFADDENILASIEAGALGYIHKDSTPEDIAQTILDMRAGASPISPMIARRVLSKHQQDQGNLARQRESTAVSQSSAQEAAQTAQTSLLTPREQDVLALIARGFSYAEIARLKSLSVHTVQSHIKRLYTKLSVHSKNEAVFVATGMGLLARVD